MMGRSRSIQSKRKNLSDVAGEEVNKPERWNALPFKPNQLRVIIINAYDPTEEPKITGGAIEHDVFMKIIRPALGAWIYYGHNNIESIINIIH